MMIYTIHTADPDRLETVKAEMANLGQPVIDVVNCGDHYRALEGTHRLYAAHALGIAPILRVFAQDDLIDISGYDWYDTANWADTKYPAGEVAGELSSPQNGDLDFDHFEIKD